jgi:hypothetical protein
MRSASRSTTRSVSTRSSASPGVRQETTSVLARCGSGRRSRQHRRAAHPTSSCPCHVPELPHPRRLRWRPSHVHKTADPLPLASDRVWSGRIAVRRAWTRVARWPSKRPGCPTFIRRAPAENEPVSITLMNVSIAVNLSIRSMPPRTVLLRPTNRPVEIGTRFQVTSAPAFGTILN